MKSNPIIINWHDSNAPIYSAHFEPDIKGGKGRLATGGGDNNVRIWKIHKDGEDRRIEYLSTLAKHTQAVNVVRWCPKGELLASAGDDGNVILWVPSDLTAANFGSNDEYEDKESWRPKHMCRSSGVEIYDLAWSPDGQHFIIGSMDNVARIYNASTGTLVRQIAEHSHYVQGVAWDPLNEYVATQSSDRSVHVYSLKNKNGSYALDNSDEKPSKIASHMKADLPGRRISSNSPAPPDMGYRSQLSVDAVIGSPVPSAPGTPTSHPLPMNPPTSAVSHSRRSSFSSRRSVSPAPSLPLPAVMPMEASPKPHAVTSAGIKNASLYANETLTSFFRRLTFTNDGSLLLTPAGQYQVQHSADGGKPSLEMINTVFIYTRGGINRPPIAHLPGHKKPSIAVKCAPFKYTLRSTPPATKHITIDTSSNDDPMPPLPESLAKPVPSVMEPPPPPVVQTNEGSSTPKLGATEPSASTPGPKPTFALPYRMVYAVATQDSVLIYDTQQTTPICVVSNLHLATFTDLTWASDGQTLLITSSDGFCSTITFADGELGQRYSEPKKSVSSQNTPTTTPTAGVAPPFAMATQHQHRNSAGSFAAPSPPAAAFVNQRPSSPTRSNSTSSIATTQSTAQPVPSSMSNATLIAGSVPGITATNSGKVTGVPITTPPETPRSTATTTSVAGTKRDAGESEKEESGKEAKKRRIAPTPVTAETLKTANTQNLPDAD